MHEYDAALKLLLQASAHSVLRQITGGAQIARWLTAEIPKVQMRRADLLGETISGELIHIELQSSNDAEMALRMADYCLGIYRRFRRFPKQIVLYVGEPELRMKSSLGGPDHLAPDIAFRYTLVDFKNLEGRLLLESEHIEDNVLAILARLQDRAAVIRRVLERIAMLPEPGRRAAFAEFLIISGLRQRVGQTIKEEAQKMPVLNDILSHEVIGPAILEGLQKGRQEGLQEGRQEVVRRLMEKRFGPVPNWAEARLAALSGSELDEVAVRLLDVGSLEELFSQKR